jgi:hypothetical protein
MNREMYIRDDLKLLDQKQTLLHECLHAMFAELGRDDWRNDEGLCDGLSGVLTDFIEDNPKLVSFLSTEREKG